MLGMSILRSLWPISLAHAARLESDSSALLRAIARATYDRSNGNYTNEAFSGAAADELRISSLVGCRFCEVDFQGRVGAAEG